MKLELHDAVSIELHMPEVVSDCACEPDDLCEGCDGTQCTKLTDAKIKISQWHDLDHTYSEIVIGLRNQGCYGPTEVSVIGPDGAVLHELKHGGND